MNDKQNKKKRMITHKHRTKSRKEIKIVMNTHIFLLNNIERKWVKIKTLSNPFKD
jgi:hypothetical protein